MNLPTTNPPPIVPFYCCYLLRSKTRRYFYIGSTPNPARRLAQHNGQSRGGAKRTSLESKRPWEMTCIVTGFPSRVAALQFEWAWQNTHATRHIERDVRDSRVCELQKGKGKKRPPMSLEARLKNLGFLMGVKSFRRWPLEIRFFAKDVWELWEKYTDKMAVGWEMEGRVRLTQAHTMVPAGDAIDGEFVYKIPDLIREIPVAYEDCKAHVEKARAVLGNAKPRRCGVCSKSVNDASSLVCICSVDTCSTVCHVSCLSSRFLEEEGDRDAIIPTHGTCPSCKRQLKWSTLMRELSLRIRGQAEIEAMFKPKRRAKPKTGSVEKELLGTQATEVSDNEDVLDETWMQDVEDGEEEYPSIDRYVGGKGKEEEFPSIDSYAGGRKKG
ncbi:uncharacterized protein EI97DRAFT_107346 [Westerdykella ornata]|uniref:GIY-YIG domain-containing protein n=1 Tax=Westerdykella ornata TaxID=318751 RepID=A0A6A6JTQ9_WESOR|nr:uncharacterized protein EI97DRAFT_107346 [Westerdykella ornata]KAF2279991.1 hypothetical protein EI97DRAFT_107346 [Westerdykella ornata]